MTPKQIEDIRQRYNMVRNKKDTGWVVQLTDEQITKLCNSYLFDGLRKRNRNQSEFS